MTATVLKFQPQAEPPVQPSALVPTPARPMPDDLPREYQEIIGAVKCCGLQRVYGVFSAENWHRAATNAGLYLIGANNWCTADVSEIRKTAEALANELNDWPSLIQWIRGDAAKQTVKWYVQKGDLLQTLFPDGSGLQPEARDTAQIRVYYPRPRMIDLPAMHSARLAGLTVGIAAPPEALSIEVSDLIADAQAHIARKKIEQIRRKQEARRREQEARMKEQRSRIDYDPIIFATDGAHTVVLGHYNTSDNDPDELRSLVATLDRLAFDI